MVVRSGLSYFYQNIWLLSYTHIYKQRFDPEMPFHIQMPDISQLWFTELTECFVPDTGLFQSDSQSHTTDHVSWETNADLPI